jgi:serine/threonine protein kinase
LLGAQLSGRIDYLETEEGQRCPRCSLRRQFQAQATWRRDHGGVMASRWFCKVGDQEHGPLTSHQIVEWARTQQLKPDDLVRKNDSGWVKAGAVRGLFEDGTVGSSSSLNQAAQQTASAGRPLDAATVAEDVHPLAAEATVQAPAPKSLGRGLSVGSELGNYTVLAKLGEGGMGMVLKARHRRMDRVVALKVLNREATQSPAAVSRFHQEVKAAARLVHPNIVTAYDADEAAGIHFLVMEYVDGMALAEVVGRNGPLPVRDAVNYILQAARGLQYAHSEGVVHRDIKPGNLLLDKRGIVKIMDMGLARMDDAEAVIGGAQNAYESLTKVGQVLGTLDYMSPEQAEDARKVDHRADIYSLGCTFYRLLTGRPPYRGDTVVNKILAHRNHPIPSLTTARKGVSSELDAVFHRMVAKKPDDRYSSLDDLMVDLEMFLEKGSVRGDTVRLAMGEAERLPDGKKSLIDAASQMVLPVGDGSDSFELAPLETGIKVPQVQVRDPHTARFVCRVMGEDLGPLTYQQLEQMKRKKQLTSEDLVRYADDDRWFTALDIAGLF